MKMNRPQLTVLSLAIIAALTAMAPTLAPADTVIGTDQTTAQHWTDDNFTVNSGVTINVADDAAVYANSGGTLGSLFNGGTIAGQEGILNNSAMDLLNNTGSIVGNSDYGIMNLSGATLNILTNSGTISGALSGVFNEALISAVLNDVGGSISALENTNSGTLNDVRNKGAIGTLDNSGMISSATPFHSGLINDGAITALENRAGGTVNQLFNIGRIDTLNNSGTLSGLIAVSNGGSMGSGTTAITGTGSIGNLNNSGSIIATGSGILNQNGTISTLTNSGSISSDFASGIFNNTGSEITTLVNTASGHIAGGVVSGDARIGIFNGGLITNLSNAGDIQGVTGISNGGTLGTGLSTVTYAGTIGTLNNSGTIVSSAAFIPGTTAGISNGLNSTIGTLNNSGTITSALIAIVNAGTINSLNNSSSGTLIGALGIANIGTINALTNDGKISASQMPPVGVAAGILNAGRIGVLTNNQGGVIGDGDAGIANQGLPGILIGTIDTLLNNGTIKGSVEGIYNSGGAITHLTNNGVIDSDRIAVYNTDGAIDTLDNNNLIHGAQSGISNRNGTINVINNSGAITGGAAIDNNSAIGSLNNLPGGVIQNGISNNASGSIATLNNQGTIAASSTSTTAFALYNQGSIGSLNNSGLITSPVDAIYLDAGSTLGGAFINSGTVAGTIRNLSSEVLSIGGGSGATFGVLTGSSGGMGAADIGQIFSPNNTVAFVSGNQLLNDNITGANSIVANTGGVLQVNNQIKIAGAYRQSAAATLNIGVASGAVVNGDGNDIGYGRLVVSGNAVIDAGSSVMLKKVNTYRFANGQRYLVIQADSTGTNYNEGSLQYGATGFNGKVTGASIADGSNRSLLLTLDGGTENLSTTSDANATLNGLFTYTGTDAGLMNLFNALAAVDTSDEQNRVGAQLSPSSGKASVAGAATVVSQQINNIAFNHLDGTSPTAGQATSGVSSGESAGNKAVWGQAFGGRASDGGRDGSSGYHASYSGLLIGADAALNDQWRAGALVSHASTSVSNDGANAGSNSHVDSYGLTAYAGYTGAPWYVNMAVGAVRSDVDSHRMVNFTGFNGVADGSYKGMQYLAAVQAGYPLNLDRVLPGAVLTPLAGLTYSTLKQDGYTETGGNGTALRTDSTDTHSVKSDLGFKLENSYKTSFGLLKPAVQLLWRHEYNDTRMQSVANFAADTSGATSFMTQGPTPITNTGVLSLGATLLHNNNLTLSVNYTLEQGGGYTSQTGSLLARWQF
jgi:outer membrane autotransporter protein